MEDAPQRGAQSIQEDMSSTVWGRSRSTATQLLSLGRPFAQSSFIHSFIRPSIPTWKSQTPLLPPRSSDF
jgi:hypothetical protein